MLWGEMRFAPLELEVIFEHMKFRPF